MAGVSRTFGVFAALGLAACAAAGAFAYRPAREIASAVRSYGPAYGVLAEIARVRSALASAERGVQEERAGEPGEALVLRPGIGPELGRLAPLLSGRPEQLDRLERLGALARATFEKAGPPGGGRRRALEMAAVIDEMEAAERDRIRRTDAAVRGSAAALLLYGGGAAFGAVLLVLLAFTLARREGLRRQLAEASLAGLQRTADHVGDLITIADRSGRIGYVNQAVEETTGYARAELVGKRSEPWLPWYASEPLLREMRDTVLSGKPFRASTTGRKKTGEAFHANETVTPLLDDAGGVAGFISAARDVTRQKELEGRLEYLDRHDPLTGLPNRRQLAELLDGATLRARETGHFLSVLIADIDQFKHINNLLGPEKGDEVLRHVARRLREAVGQRDIVARVGSDSFAVVHFDDSQPVGVAATAEAIRRAVSQTLPGAGRDFTATVAIGIAVYPHNGRDAHALLQNADLALGEARSQGRNAIRVFDDSITSGVPEILSFEKRLFGALEGSEYLLHYQPYFDLATLRPAGAEALIKWRNGDLGLVSPAQFIPSLEDTGMIVDVGRWVLETACKQIKEWAFPISVNLSSVQFHHEYLVGMVTEAVCDSGLDPAFLTLEVTESVFLHDLDFAMRTLKRLKDVGVSLSVDDFGTGYSSLSYLKKLPLDTIKIDMSFVQDVARDPDSASIVMAITTLARGLGLKTIAEGVETEEQRNVLHLLRCDMGQGYHFSRAVPAPEFGKFLGREPRPPPGLQ